MTYKQFLDNQDYWKQAYCSAIASEFSPSGRAQFADKAVEMYCERLEKALKENEDAEIAGRIAPNHFEIEDD